MGKIYVGFGKIDLESGDSIPSLRIGSRLGSGLIDFEFPSILGSFYWIGRRAAEIYGAGVEFTNTNWNRVSGNGRAVALDSLAVMKRGYMARICELRRRHLGHLNSLT